MAAIGPLTRTQTAPADDSDQSCPQRRRAGRPRGRRDPGCWLDFVRHGVSGRCSFAHATADSSSRSQTTIPEISPQMMARFGSASPARASSMPCHNAGTRWRVSWASVHLEPLRGSLLFGARTATESSCSASLRARSFTATTWRGRFSAACIKADGLSTGVGGGDGVGVGRGRASSRRFCAVPLAARVL